MDQPHEPQAPTPHEIWKRALAELQLQMSRATFEQWLRGTEGIALDGDTLVIGVANTFAVEALEHQLKKTITRALAAEGFHGATSFVVVMRDVLRPVEPREHKVKLSPAMIEVIDFDPSRNGYLLVHHYATWFWQPYLGSGPFLLWQTIRAYGEANKPWPTVVRLAAHCAGGDRQKLLGRPDRGQIGWLEMLENERILWCKRSHNKYTYRVLKHLPLLTPAQVSRLPAALQKEHEHILKKHALDYEEWEQLALPTLADTKRWVSNENLIG
jgi:hypothetical protein